MCPYSQRRQTSGKLKLVRYVQRRRACSPVERTNGVLVFEHLSSVIIVRDSIRTGEGVPASEICHMSWARSITLKKGIMQPQLVSLTRGALNAHAPQYAFAFGVRWCARHHPEVTQ